MTYVATKEDRSVNPDRAAWELRWWALSSVRHLAPKVQSLGVVDFSLAVKLTDWIREGIDFRPLAAFDRPAAIRSAVAAAVAAAFLALGRDRVAISPDHLSAVLSDVAGDLVEVSEIMSVLGSFQGLLLGDPTNREAENLAHEGFLGPVLVVTFAPLPTH